MLLRLTYLLQQIIIRLLRKVADITMNFLAVLNGNEGDKANGEPDAALNGMSRSIVTSWTVQRHILVSLDSLAHILGPH